MNINELFERRDGSIFKIPKKHAGQHGIANTFIFENTDNYHDFSSEMTLKFNIDLPDTNKIDEHIVKVKGGWELKSKKTGKNLGKYPTKAGAERRERQVQYFKHAKEGAEPIGDNVTEEDAWHDGVGAWHSQNSDQWHGQMSEADDLEVMEGFLSSMRDDGYEIL
jgi:hypothetical protein